MGIGMVDAGIKATEIPHIPNVGFIDPDMILQFVASRLRDTDGQMQVLMDKQRQSERAGEILTRLQNQLSAYSDGTKTKDDAAAMLEFYRQAIQDAGGEKSEVGGKIAEARDGFLKVGIGEDGVANATECQNACSDITRIQTDLGHAGELSMMKLQSLASMRQQVIQMSTNVMSNFNQSAMAIANNTGK